MFKLFFFINNGNVTEFEDVNFILPFVLCCLLIMLPFGLSASLFCVLFIWQSYCLLNV